MRIIAIANQKGGCGKTTTAVNLAVALAEKSKKTLIVDLDPQGHSTIGFGYDPDSLTMTIYNALMKAQPTISEIIVGTKIESLDLAPSNVLLSGAEIELASVVGREFVLAEKLKTVKDRYDICVIDCPPSLGLLTLNSLVASTDVIVPVQVEYYAMEGLKQLFETANIIREHLNACNVKILGLLLTFVEKRRLLSSQTQKQMREYFGALVFDTVIHRCVRLAEAPSAGQPIFTYAPESRAAAEYRALAEEIINGKAPAEQISEDEASPEQISEDEASPEQIIEGEDSPEQISEDEASPEQITEGEDSPEQISEDEDSPEQISEDEASPEQIIEGEDSPEQIIEGEDSPEQISEDEDSPEQISEDGDSPEQIIEGEDSPEQISEDGDSPEQIIEGEDSPEQISEDGDSPEQIIEGEDSPEQITEDQALARR
jgi:chromosome partitioning protein